MVISKKNCSNAKGIVVPAENIFALPEKVLQFGTGVLLRGLPDYFIDKANKQNIFNGRVVVVKSTASGGTDAFAEQDGLYTHIIQGIENGNRVEETILNASVSRVLSATNEWNEILECAANPQMQIIISNTTEVGITLVEDDKINAVPPVSFPGKLLGFLYKRYEIFNGDVSKGMVIIPTELLVDNGKKLATIILQLAKNNNLSEAFINWLQTANYFCSSLVDRIVPGKLPAAQQKEIENSLGYEDGIMITSEPYRLWAIEAADEKVEEILSFAKADDGVVIAPDINVFRELKLRLLNGTHTYSCGVAVLAGFTTVKEAMENKSMSNFVSNLMLQEIVPVVATGHITTEAAIDFSHKVIDRFRNPYIEHKWLSITVQYTSKMKMRNLPVLLKHYENTSTVPQHMALGFAAYILFMQSEKNGTIFSGITSKGNYTIEDDSAAILHDIWKKNNTSTIVKAVLSDSDFWGADLSMLNGFEQAVNNYLQSLLVNPLATIETVAKEKIVA